MKSEAEIREAVQHLVAEDMKCPRCKEGRVCIDASHAIYGTYLAVLHWVLEQGDAPWEIKRGRT